MLPSMNDIGVAEEHRRDLLREAAQLHEGDLAAAALRELRARRRPLHARALAGLGRLLVAWGARLQAMEAAEAHR